MADIPDGLITALADRYLIEREIGSGGMAVVYLAHDRKLGRPVAVKVLRSDYAASVGYERFLREIDTAAKLTHPNIIPLHDSGEADGLLYYVMPYVEGETLRNRLKREKRLPVADAVHITRQVAEALHYAHEHGVVHRDIKPENILLEEGVPVVADFGIARAITAAGGDKLTTSGIVIGTPQYMSPEQGCGEPNIDERTDVYALGCVLHEMLSGEPPFTGRTAQEVIARKVSERPPSIRSTRSEVPAWLDQIARTALATTAADRFQTAEDLSHCLATQVAPRRGMRATGLERLAAHIRARFAIVAIGAILIGAALALGPRLWNANDRGTTSVFPATNIAVLGLQDFSDEDNSYLAAGFTDFLTRHLAGFPALTVPSYEIMRRYEERNESIDSIVARHQIGTLVEGNLIANDEQVQVSIYLTDARTGVQIASLPTLLRPRAEITVLLSDLGYQVARLLRRQLGDIVAERSIESGTECGECLEHLFMSFRFNAVTDSLVMAGDTVGAAAALDSVESRLRLAESLDRNWVRPIIRQGWIAAYRAQLFTDRPRTYDPQYTRIGIEHAERALSKEPSNASALELRGILYSYLAEALDDPDERASHWASAESDLQSAVALEPTRAAAWSRLSYIYWRNGRFMEAKQAAESALRADVWIYNDDTILMRLCQITFDLEQFDEATRWCVEEGRARFPRRTGFAWFELTLLASSGGPPPDPTRAWQLADSLVQLFRPHRQAAVRPLVLMDVASVLARAGLTDSARSVIRHALEIAPAEDPRLIEREAMARLQLGENDRVIVLLARYLEARPNQKERIRKDWWWRPLQEHPGFQALLE